MTGETPTRSMRGGRLLFGVAVATACAVFPLIIVGAGVTSQDAGMAYPDWPTSGGHLVNPPQWWQQADTRWEHGHRLIGWTVGMLSILLVTLSWRRGGVMRLAAIATLIAISLQGVMGGIRVIEVSREWAMAHGIWGQLCFCLAAVCALMASSGWNDRRRSIEVSRGPGIRRLGIAACLVVFLQLGFGAALRHFGGNYALVAHLLWAMVVLFLLGWLAMWVMAECADRAGLTRLGRVLGGLLLAQLLLGALAFVVTVMEVPASAFVIWAVPSAHVAVGALLLACCVLLTFALSRSPGESLARDEAVVAVGAVP